jgi:hypothetical protein
MTNDIVILHVAKGWWVFCAYKGMLRLHSSLDQMSDTPKFSTLKLAMQYFNENMADKYRIVACIS